MLSLMPVTLLTLGLTIAFQLAALIALAPSRLVGDEAEYAFGGAGGGAHPLWIRVPLQGWLVRLFDRTVRLPNVGGGRMFSGCCAIAAATLATGYVEHSHGSWAALITAAILIVSVERAVLAIHLWPDSFLSLLLLLFALLLQDPTTATAPWLAVIASLAFAIRVDNAALVPVAVLAPLVMLPQQAPGAVLFPAAIVAVAIGALCLRSRLLFDSWLPDTTFAFNLAVARRDIAQPNATVDTLMSETARARRDTAAPAPRGRKRWSRAVSTFLIRLKTILGPETFVAQQLVARGVVGYRRSGLLTPPSPLAALLKHGFTVTVALLLLSLTRAPDGLLFVFGTFVFVYSFVQTRSRYRVALLPLLAVIVGTALPGTVEALASGGGVPLLSVAALLALAALLWAVPARREI